MSMLPILCMLALVGPRTAGDTARYVDYGRRVWSGGLIERASSSSFDVFAVMYFVVLPLTLSGQKVPSGSNLAGALAIHMLGVGLPIAYAARRHLKPA